MIGSMPHTDPAEACAQVTRFLKDLPAWPQLSKRSFLESMYVQFSQGFPGLSLANEKVTVDRTRDLDKPLEEFYAAYLANDVDKYPISVACAAGLHRFVALTGLSPKAVKGQIVGPISWGLCVTDNEGKAVLYEDTLADAGAKLLRLKAAWQERELKKISANTIIFVDEPSMASFGSAFFNISKEKVVSLLEEVLGGISGLKGLHCCGNTDWSVLMGTSLDIVSFDAYSYAQSLALYPVEVTKLLGKGGCIAWGIVPNEEESLAKETVASLQDRLEEAMAPFTRKGIAFKQLLKQSLLTPCCGLERLKTPEGSGRALELLAALSRRIRSRYI